VEGEWGGVVPPPNFFSILSSAVLLRIYQNSDQFVGDKKKFKTSHHRSDEYPGMHVRTGQEGEK